jgi:Tol biopolymer transport system component
LSKRFFERLSVGNSSGCPIIISLIVVLVFVIASFVLRAQPALQVNWSPEGDWIIFSCSNITRSDPQSALYIVRPDGSDLQKITGTQFVALSPSWSPDGEWIAFRSRNRLLKIRPDGTDVQELTSTSLWSNIYTPVWSPNGRWIAYSTDSIEDFGRSEISLFQIETHQDETIFHVDGAITDLTWSPDSTKILFTLSSSLATSGIYSVDIAEKNYELVFHYNHIMENIAWEHHDSSILLNLYEQRQPDLFLFDLDNRTPVPMNISNFDGSPSWSSQGDWIAFRGYDSRNNRNQIYKIRDDGTGLQRITNLEGCYTSDPDWISF